MARTFRPLDPRSMLAAFSGQAPPRGGGIPLSHDELVACALQSAGYGALLALPLLLLASLMLEAPVAGPALIASGYLGIAFALRTDRPARAAVMSAIVLSGLVGWLLLCLASGAIPLSGPGLMAALLAPFFASSPTLARLVIASRADRAPERPLGNIAARSVAALAIPSPASPPNQIRKSERPDAGLLDSRAESFPAADVEDAVRFAVRHVRPKADARRISLSVKVEGELGAACDQQTCRRIARALMDHVVAHTAAGGTVSLSARKIKGVVLLRVQSDSRLDLSLPKDRCLAAARATVEAAGGTLLVDCARDGLSLSARLDLAAVGMANESAERKRRG